jgi:uncharacterized coiled-coil protein SlyX
MNNDHSPKADEQRLQKLELSLMHLQNDYDQLNQVVIDQANRLEQLKRSVAKLTDQLERAKEPAEARNAEEEKPPHY